MKRSAITGFRVNQRADDSSRIGWIADGQCADGVNQAPAKFIVHRGVHSIFSPDLNPNFNPRLNPDLNLPMIPRSSLQSCQ